MYEPHKLPIAELELKERGTSISSRCFVTTCPFTIDRSWKRGQCDCVRCKSQEEKQSIISRRSLIFNAACLSRQNVLQRNILRCICGICIKHFSIDRDFIYLFFFYAFLRNNNIRSRDVVRYRDLPYRRNIIKFANGYAVSFS